MSSLTDPFLMKSKQGVYTVPSMFDDLALVDPVPQPAVLPALDEAFVLDVVKVNGRKVWPYFAPHHYLTAKFAGHHAFMAVLPTGEPVAFASIVSFPHGHIKRGWREHRTVVLPDFQGLGIGARLSDWMGEWVLTVKQGRFFSKTSHPRFGAFRDASPYWRATSSNRKTPKAHEIQAQAKNFGWVADTTRQCFSHEYIGRPDNPLRKDDE